MVPLDFANFYIKESLPPSFVAPTSAGNIWFWMDFGTFVLFCGDMTLTFFTTTEDMNGNPVADMRTIARTYMFGRGQSWKPGWFFLDLISVLPDFLVYLLRAISMSSQTVQFPPAFWSIYDTYSPEQVFANGCVVRHCGDGDCGLDCAWWGHRARHETRDKGW